ncbi:Flavin-dependent oxidoreductase, luciferase family (includes alkanesulfonate monooxygenase SsuD and methylene tetrahydromethanopterin reductase) [Pseudonocardia thermophila]|uniref:Flavin-dependent oxidoreductase, luciferase family (Includes alkanesulfonate monooxygenase SsuD and methylene tetrahydromethanopterin reductase) n=1 Tax=Pseudonocardia thermophila TaxID=1848 RepID=A0A1M6S1J1_PSETH|nr:LLM class flavin-dependent oxidoreductase [Pseudonocardia thermophila]SHK38563.1 Flavin-dependent oxidoreductase, luciferase family (includes alkanesulfonate monooxygenase SsuD and methylene tetrahydromethanopterin reductase) [Pseudonocardia thermophila]
MDRWGLSMGVSPREPLTNVTELAAAAEANGFEAMWFIDFQLGMKDVYAAMYLAALATTNLNIGAAVTNLVTRHPTVTANATVALDELSHGHAMLGLGAGWSAVYGAGGQPSKLGDLSAGIDELRRLFTGEEQELYGTKVRLATARRQIPIYLAVSQPGMLRLAGRKCDGAILMGAADPEFVEWQLEYIHEGLRRSGRDRSELLIDLTVTMSVDEDQEKALNDVRAWATSQAATFHSWKQMPPAWERFRPEFAAANSEYHLVEHLSRHAGHKQAVSDEFVRSVALVGTTEQCVARLKQLCALDIDRITFALLSGGRRRRMEQLAREIIPAVEEAS